MRRRWREEDLSLWCWSWALRYTTGGRIRARRQDPVIRLADTSRGRVLAFSGDYEKRPAPRLYFRRPPAGAFGGLCAGAPGGVELDGHRRGRRRGTGELERRRVHRRGRRRGHLEYRGRLSFRIHHVHG